MKNKKKIIILVIICLVVLIGAIVADRILSKSYLKEIKYDEIIEKIENDESFIFLIGQTTCAYCKSYKPKLEKVAKKYEIEMYYIEADLLNDEEEAEFLSYVSFSSTPITVFIKNGEESSMATRINGNASIEKIENKLKSNGFIE